MKTRLCLFVLLLVSVSATIFAYSQGEKKPRTDADYRVRTLSELTTLQPDYIANSPDYQNSKNLRIIVHGELLPSRVKVLYDGTTRPVVQKRKLVITEWANKFAGAPEFYTVPYDTEMLFNENGTSYWLVVKKEFLPRFEQVVKKGEVVELFLIKFGNAHIDEDDKLEPVLLVEKFEKPGFPDQEFQVAANFVVAANFIDRGSNRNYYAARIDSVCQTPLVIYSPHASHSQKF